MIGKLWRRIFGGEETIKLKLTADEITALINKCNGHKTNEGACESAVNKLAGAWVHSPQGMKIQMRFSR